MKNAFTPEYEEMLYELDKKVMRDELTERQWTRELKRILIKNKTCKSTKEIR
jgi:hypothetical protein